MTQYKALGQKLVSLGFREYEHGWRLREGDAVGCVEVQRSRQRAAYCVELGVHYSFLRPVPRDAADDWLAHATRPDCAFHERLPVGRPETWWPTRQGSELAALEFERSGLPWIGKYFDIAELFGGLPTTDPDDEAVWSIMPGVSWALRPEILARILDYLGRRAEALQVVDAGLEQRRPSGPRLELKRLREVLRAAG